MQNKTVLLLGIISFCVLKVVQLAAVDPGEAKHHKLTKEELLKIALECIEEVKINKTVVQAAMKSIIVPKENEKYRHYLVCSYKKQGYLSEDGTTMLYDNIMEFLEELYNKSDLQGLERCKSITREDPGELCVENLDCIIEELRKVKSISEQKNSID